MRFVLHANGSSLHSVSETYGIECFNENGDSGPEHLICYHGAHPLPSSSEVRHVALFHLGAWHAHIPVYCPTFVSVFISATPFSCFLVSASMHNPVQPPFKPLHNRAAGRLKCDETAFSSAVEAGPGVLGTCSATGAQIRARRTCSCRWILPRPSLPRAEEEDVMQGWISFWRHLGGPGPGGGGVILCDWSQ